MTFAKRCAWLVGFCVFAASTAWAECPSPEQDILGALNCIPGVKASESRGAPSGYRRFDLRFKQPVDHKNPAGQSFDQYVILFHRRVTDPMVLHTSGYSIFGAGLSALAQTFATNQIQVEHRYFAKSIPSPRNVQFLTVEQSAADFHRIVSDLKTIYKTPWVGTGASKGGMTSVYHRYFYPDDLTGTVADVAPLSFDRDDPRYIDFVDQVGGDEFKTCRADLERFQNQLLSQRQEILQRITEPFTQLGSASVGLEHAVTEFPFTFWQYQQPTLCQSIPSATASVDQTWSFMSWVNGPSNYGDGQYQAFWPYFFQAGTELGGPASKRSHLNGLQHDYSLQQYMPADGKDIPYSSTLMHDVERWVRDDAENIVFVYGEFDPWSAGAFPEGTGSGMHHFVVPRGNHSANFTELTGADRQKALSVLEEWFGRAPVAKEFAKGSTLDELEFQARKAAHLP